MQSKLRGNVHPSWPVKSSAIIKNKYEQIVLINYNSIKTVKDIKGNTEPKKR